MKTVNTLTSDDKKVGWVFYDGSCRFCRGLARRWKPGLERRRFRLAPLQSAGVAEQLGLTGPELLREMRVLTPQGRLLGGADAVIELARGFWWARWLVAFGRFPLGLRLVRKAYRWVAARRGCDEGACASGTRRVYLLPFLLLPAAAILITVRAPGWLQMWSVAAGLFFGVKWLVWRGREDVLEYAGRGLMRGQRPVRAPGLQEGGSPVGAPGVWRTIGFFLLWPGMDVGEFLSGRKESPRPGRREWVGAVVKTGVGALLVWMWAREAHDISPLLAGWVGMAGLVLSLHFGVFHLLSLGWRSAGVVAKPIMNAPLRAVALAEFWGRRWNLGFSGPARCFVHRPLAARAGNAKAMLAVFLVSGLVHELVISLPARGGYGLPTAYFLFQGLAICLERSRAGRRLGLGSGVRGWIFAMLCAALPAVVLFHPPFVHRVILPFLRTISAI